MNFIQTQDESTAEKLQKQGFVLVNKQGNIWTFMNSDKLNFSADDSQKIVYSNKLCV